MRGYIEDTVGRYDYCLSITHVIELSEWEDAAAAKEMCGWLDEMPKVWVKSPVVVARDEVRQWLAHALGGPKPSKASPITRSMLAVFEGWEVSQLPDVINNATISRLVSGVRGERFLDVREHSLQLARVFWQDEKKSAIIDPDEALAILDAKWKEAMKKEFLEAHRHMLNSVDETYICLGSRPPCEYEVYEAVDGLLERCDAIPLLNISNLYTRNQKKAVGRQRPFSRRSSHHGLSKLAAM